jgi:predicted GNAT superfamily acetyltransferase
MPQDLRDLSKSPNVPAAVAGADNITLRQLDSLDEYRACVALQIEIWGADFSDIVPASMLHVATHVGGLVAGAFDGDALLGFVFGLTGVKHDEVVHWSHMLGVRPAAREMGIGRRLKEFQRKTLAERGVEREFWTFDPLQARNAHLNVNRLGVRVVDYVVNMYGNTGSPLHFGIDTDRLIVECATSGPTRRDTPMDTAALDPQRLPVLTPCPRSGDARIDGDRPGVALIEIPSDVQSLVEDSPEEMKRWRLATRSSFQWAFLQGYRVTALHRHHATGRSFYVIARDVRREER